MGRYTWLWCHGEVHLAMVSWGGTPGYGVMGRYTWLWCHGEVHLAMVSWRRYTWLWCHGERYGVMGRYTWLWCHAVSDVHFQLTLLNISALTHNHTNWKDLTHALFITRTHTPHMPHIHMHQYLRCTKSCPNPVPSILSSNWKATTFLMESSRVMIGSLWVTPYVARETRSPTNCTAPCGRGHCTSFPVWPTPFKWVESTPRLSLPGLGPRGITAKPSTLGQTGP